MAERQRLEREAQRAEHFALLGRLAAGISHEIRNPLGAVFLHVDLLAEELQQPSPESPTVLAEALAEIKTNLVRLDDLVQDYLSLVRVGASSARSRIWAQPCRPGAPSCRRRWRCPGSSLQMHGLADLGTVAFHASTLRRAPQPGAQRPRCHAAGRHGHPARPGTGHARAARGAGYRQWHTGRAPGADL